ncbi:MAG: HDOD domain-containing protein [Chlorobi bacterium]|nr:HDOD domain-containing protein [Chlorobiota bacterium]
MARFLKKIEDIPTLPEVAIKIIQLSLDEKISNKDFEEYIHLSPDLVIKIFRLINSPFFGLPYKVKDLSQAIGLLGRKTIRNLALTFFLIDTIKDISSKEEILNYWKLMVLGSNIAKLISKRDDIFVASLLYYLPHYFYLVYENKKLNSVTDDYYVAFIDVANKMFKKWHIPEEIQNLVFKYFKYKFDEEELDKETLAIFIGEKFSKMILLEGVKHKDLDILNTYLKMKEESFSKLIERAIDTTNFILDFFNIPDKIVNAGNIINLLAKANQKIFDLYQENYKLLRETEELNKILSTSFNNLPLGVMVFEGDECILTNLTAERILEGKKDRLEDILDEEIIETLKSHPGDSIKLITTLKNKKVVDLTYFKSMSGKTIKVFLFFRDLTEELKLKERYKYLKENYEELIHSAGIGIVIIDLKGNIIFANKKFCDILKIKNYESLKNKQLKDFICVSKECEFQIINIFKEILSGNAQEKTIQIKSQNRLKEEIYLEITITIYRDAGSVKGFQLLVNDITDKKKLEVEKEKMQKNVLESEKHRVLVELAGTTAHELNQPLTNLMLSLEMLKTIDEVKKSKYLERIEQATERIAEIVKKFSNVTKYKTKDYLDSSKIIDLGDE